MQPEEEPPADQQGYPPPGYPPPGYPPPGYPPGYWWPAQPPLAQPPRGLFSRLFGSALTAWVVAGVLALAVAGLATTLATSSSSNAVFSAPASGKAGPGGFYGPGPGAQGPGFYMPGRGAVGPGGALRAGRVVGTVANVAGGTFTLNTRSGETVTVKEQSSTVYRSASGGTASASSVVFGARVGVMGSVSGTTVTADQIVILPPKPFGFGP